MTKQDFIKIMTDFISLKKDTENLSDAFKKFDPNFNYISFDRYETLVLNTLQLVMNDVSQWIAYWIYDLDMGKDAKRESVTDKNGKPIPIKTLGNLYDLIKSN